MKITYSSENINSFGRINFADHIVRNASVYKTIDQILGGRGIKAEYSYSDLIRSITQGWQQILKLFSSKKYHLLLE